jgi:hypothetical protein
MSKRGKIGLFLQPFPFEGFLRLSPSTKSFQFAGLVWEMAPFTANGIEIMLAA